MVKDKIATTIAIMPYVRYDVAFFLVSSLPPAVKNRIADHKMNNTANIPNIMNKRFSIALKKFIIASTEESVPELVIVVTCAAAINGEASNAAVAAPANIFFKVSIAL